MKRKVYRCEGLKNVFPEALKFFAGSDNIGVFDIETTGLKPDNCSVILIGFLKREKNEYRLYQYFAENTLEEGMILKAFFDDLKGTDCLVSYNGQSFDIPFINRRIEIADSDNGNEIDTSSFDKVAHFDIYRILRYYSDIKSFLPDLRQKTVEKYMGIDLIRKDEISGKESVELYYEYISFPKKEIMEKILLHNRDDVLQLFKLIPVIRNADVYRAFYEKGFPAWTNIKHSEYLSDGRIIAHGEDRDTDMNMFNDEGDGCDSKICYRHVIPGFRDYDRSNGYDSKTYLEVKKIKIRNRMLEVSGVQRYNEVDYISYGQANERDTDIACSNAICSDETCSDKEYSGAARSNEMRLVEFDKEKRTFKLLLPLAEHNDMTNYAVLDLHEAGADICKYEKYPQCDGKLLMLRVGEDVFYLQVLEFVRDYLEKIIVKR